MLSLLRGVTLHHCRVTAGSDRAEARAEAHANLFKYAKLVSQHLGVKACSYNLHLMVCRYTAAHAVSHGLLQYVVTA